MSTRVRMIAAVLAGSVLMSASVACGGGAVAGPGDTSVSTTSGPTTSTVVALEDLEPVTQPTLPEDIPGYVEIDPATGLHMTGTPTVVDLATYRLTVTGKVEHELSLTYDQLRTLPRVTAAADLVCPGYFTDRAEWTGVPLKTIVDMAVAQADAKVIALQGADDYLTGTPLTTALAAGGFLAYEMNGQPLSALQGFPLRAVFPGQPGSLWAKWITKLTVD